ncbi:MAG: hypothetical protein E6J34_24445, partial [Chloroflexi bacterium]
MACHLPHPRSDRGDATGFGLTPADHPFLSATLEQADGEGLLLTGQLSLPTHPWLADHAVSGTPLLPGTAFVDLALFAADQAACDRVEELTIHTPLVLPEQGALQLQLSISSPDVSGQRSLAIYSRQTDQRWTQHATGLLGKSDRTPPVDLLVFPPA